ncbi:MULTISPECIES: type I-E CRISPR-associated protein Cse1/CasA [unclassified Streptomyces]|uniref:type I-E CRISPR-associated protein Cse1/CasA n=1 Tax=unclassified Streptomyces TaxID=2593676 RepID=UPI00081E95A3|nr:MULTISPECIES: type I-E CRISPR-associated protein Cse1/CasA [unclassified Streptomyces]MYR92304.1 type I-E CRISPR-associated protein Cse1/CasA [Streptomyces sp. SID4937]SCD31234.1 CRISPR-associated protein, Cse1 family [Streptomyces sp. ScaeMP-e83]
MPALPPPSITFSAADHPWINVRTGPQYDQVGLRDLFLDAHSIDDLALPHPPAASALLRIAVAITARITGLDDPELTASQWNALRRTCLDKGRFDPGAVHAYFDQHTWDVFDPVRPWLQEPALRTQCDHSSGINAFVPGRPAGNNLAWFSPHGHHTTEPVPTAEALEILLIHHYYGRSGRCTPRTVDGVTTGRQNSGPLRSSVSFHPLGRTLHETLLAGVPVFTGDEQFPGADACPWEEAAPGPQNPPTGVTWPGRLLTGLSQHAILLVPGSGGSTVTDAYLTWAAKEPKELKQITTDPYLTYRFITERKNVARRRIKHSADASRAWWRELDTLVLAHDEHGTHLRPAIFGTLNDLPEDLRRNLRIRVHGFDQDGKVIDRQWYTAITPPLLNWTQEHDPVKAQRIAECCRGAEQTAQQLTALAKEAWNTATRSRTTQPPWSNKALTRYWPKAETVFWRLLAEPDADVPAAFAAAAAAALREVTEAARISHNSAARAVAHAIRDLYRRPPAPPKKTA